MPTASVPTTPTDPELARLVPHQSPRATTALTAVAALVLLAAWFSPVLRPSVVGSSSEGVGVGVSSSRQVLTRMALSPQGWPSFTVESVSDVPGARVLGAWLAPHEGENVPGFTVTEDVSAALVELEDARLPQRIRPSASVQLVIAWQITDCTALDDGGDLTVMLRSAFGQQRTEQLPDWMAPALFDSHGACAQDGTWSVDESGW